MVEKQNLDQLTFKKQFYSIIANGFFGNKPMKNVCFFSVQGFWMGCFILV
jgi:hypothetical protein